MSFLLESELDREYILKLNREIKLIKQSKLDWTIDHVIRFSSLLNIEESISDIIANWEIDGAKLFDIEYLSANLDCLITDRNYMPLYKLFHVVSAILQLTESPCENGKRKEENEVRSIEEEGIDIAEEVIVGLKEELEKLNNTSVIELSCGQLTRILKNMKMCEESESVRKWGADGFSLVCIMGNEGDSQTLRNYFSDEGIRLLTRLSHIFLHLYYWQHGQAQQVTTTLNDLQLDDFGVQFNDINFQSSKSFHSSQFGTSEQGEEPDLMNEPARRSQFGVSQRGSVGVSQYAISQRGSVGVSEYGVSIRGSVRGSVGISQVGSVRGSTRDSVAGSYASSEIMQESMHCSDKKENNVITVSTIEDDSMMAVLMASALRLPFNLLNLEPLQRIKISSIPYPFNLSKSNAFAKKESYQTNNTNDNSSQQTYESIYDLIDQDQEIREFKVFNLTGAKFGRNPENDFSYPDELSISGKHAQIVFKDQSYYIRDLGSKTGTFVYLSQRKPLVLSDEQLVQLSYEVQFKVIILKNDINEGIIKFEVKKPENEPPYRAILKNGNTVRIGKGENSHIKLNYQSISAYHAQIKYEQGRFVMYDCNTRTGTWLRLSAKGLRSADRKLTKHDIIRISSKKTFFIQDMTEGIEFAHCCEATKGKHDAH